MMTRLTTLLLMGLLVSASAIGAEPADVKAEHANQPAAPPPKSDSNDVGYHDLICKPNGTEDGFDCADEATPAKIVPIPSQMAWPRQQDLQVSG